jgi:Tfp pilus assembly protein PilN
VSWQAPNLAADPFENLRPVRRVSGLLLVVALALTAWNVGTWVRAGSGAAARTAELERLTRETEQSNARIATLQQDLASADLDAANRKAEFLNERIAARAFSWNLLLDRLVEKLPPGVRLRQLAPASQKPRSDTAGARRREDGPETVTLTIAGEAEDDDALLALVDHLFADPGFVNPNLARESVTSAGLVQFNLTVDYRPEEPAHAARASATGASSVGAPGPPATVPPASAPAAGSEPDATASPAAAAAGADPAGKGKP